MTSPFTTPSTRIPRASIREHGTSGPGIAALFTTAAAILALLLATALPAHADKKNDLAKALIAALVIGAIVHETKRNDPAPAPAPQPEPVRRGYVPAVCAISIEGAERDVTLYPESCLRREGVDDRLPGRCANSARVFGQDDRVYSAQCLRDAGFRVSVR